MENSRTILVFRFSSIGDIVQLSSPLQTLKDQFPNARLDVITLEEYAEILIGNPFVNRIIKISRNYSYNHQSYNQIHQIMDLLNHKVQFLLQKSHLQLQMVQN